MKYIFPTLLQTANTINSHSWFDIKTKLKSDKTKKKKVKIKVKYKVTNVITLQLTAAQKDRLKLLLDDTIDVYNLTNKYIKSRNLTRNDMNFYDIRKKLNRKIRKICNINKLPKHTADYAVKHCVTMYKSAFTNQYNRKSFMRQYKDNCKNKKFNIRDMEKSRRRKNLVIEPAAISKVKNSFFSLGHIDSNMPLKENIKCNSVLRYDSFTDKFIIITPRDVTNEFEFKKEKKCGVDIGVRTFLTTYSKQSSIEVGTNTSIVIDSIHKKLDSINSSKQQNLISSSRYNELYTKYSDKLKHKIEDLHNKSANLLLSNYETVVIGKVNIKKMLSKQQGKINKRTKRRLVALSHYRFRTKLKSMAPKFGSKVYEINEFQTSMKCHNCKFLKRDLGSSKVYNCSNCKLNLDRDVNAAINIYRMV